MNNLFALLGCVVLLSAPISHSKYQRAVAGVAAGQNYVAIDETIWSHARSDLGDLRLVAADAEIPYTLAVQRGSFEQDRRELKVFQQALVQGKTQFLIDMSGLAEYDHVQLKLDTKDFVAHALIEGQDEPHARTWSNLGSTILYDLSRDHLGSNMVVRIPRSTYRYLRLTIDGPISPRDVQGAVSEMAEEHLAVWRDVSATPAQSQSGKDTVFNFSVPKDIAVERVTFAVAPEATNFWREVEIRDEKDAWLGSGEIERVHMVRGGEKIDTEQLDVRLSENGHEKFRVIVHNGDDRPLNFTDAQLQQLERRVYFEVPAPEALVLYYGDEDLNSPAYDYSRLFLQAKNATAATLGPESANPGFTTRPDRRPWSERHPAILWIAIVAAVLGLGSVALRSMRTAQA
jgi:hypothetical protein